MSNIVEVSKVVGSVRLTKTYSRKSSLHNCSQVHDSCLQESQSNTNLLYFRDLYLNRFAFGLSYPYFNLKGVCR